MSKGGYLVHDNTLTHLKIPQYTLSYFNGTIFAI